MFVFKVRVQCRRSYSQWGPRMLRCRGQSGPRMLRCQGQWGPSRMLIKFYIKFHNMGKVRKPRKIMSLNDDVMSQGSWFMFCHDYMHRILIKITACIRFLLSHCWAVGFAFAVSFLASHLYRSPVRIPTGLNADWIFSPYGGVGFPPTSKVAPFSCLLFVKWFLWLCVAITISITLLL